MRLNVSGIRGNAWDFNGNVEKKHRQRYTQTRKGLQLTSSVLDRCHKLGNKTASITNRNGIVKFTNPKVRDRVYAAMETLGDWVFVNENVRVAFFCHQEVSVYYKTQQTWVAGCRLCGTIQRIDLDTKDNKNNVLLQDIDIVESIKEGIPVWPVCVTIIHGNICIMWPCVYWT